MAPSYLILLARLPLFNLLAGVICFYSCDQITGVGYTEICKGLVDLTGLQCCAIQVKYTYGVVYFVFVED